jgi:hypothetical protein
MKYGIYNKRLGSIPYWWRLGDGFGLLNACGHNSYYPSHGSWTLIIPQGKMPVTKEMRIPYKEALQKIHLYAKLGVMLKRLLNVKEKGEAKRWNTEKVN